MYDMDGNGYIELSEMQKLVKSIFQMMNHTNAHRAHLNPSERARKCEERIFSQRFRTETLIDRQLH